MKCVRSSFRFTENFHARYVERILRIDESQKHRRCSQCNKTINNGDPYFSKTILSGYPLKFKKSITFCVKCGKPLYIAYSKDGNNFRV